MAASVGFASAQLSHAQRLKAEFGRLQAIYAAESGVYAALDATSDVPVTPLSSDGGALVSFQARFGSDAWISSTGSAEIGGDTYRATARAYTSGGRILMWEIP